MKRVLASGYFDPIHIGHLEYLEKAKAQGDYLIVAVNSDESAIRKKGYYFIKQADRMKIIGSLKCVDEVIPCIDEDDTVAKTIAMVKPDVFAKGGDRTIDNLPKSEIDACKINGVQIVTNLGDKIESSSRLVDNYNKNVKQNCIVDLHMHTKYSDGGLDVDEIFNRLKSEGVKIASITDHNSIEAYKNMKDVERYGIELINGIEIDVAYCGAILHLLMYGFNFDNQSFKNYLQVVRDGEVAGFKNMLKQLSDLYNLSFDESEVEQFIQKNSYFDKVRLNNFLVEQKLVPTASDAFYIYTKPVVQSKRYAMPVEDFFEMAKDCNASTIMAHPMKYLKYFDSINRIKQVIIELKKLGLDGIEVYNNRQTKDEEIELLNFAQCNDLQISGGSDFHSKIGDVEKKSLGRAIDSPILLKNLNLPKIINI